MAIDIAGGSGARSWVHFEQRRRRASKRFVNLLRGWAIGVFGRARCDNESVWRRWERECGGGRADGGAATGGAGFVGVGRGAELKEIFIVSYKKRDKCRLWRWRCGCGPSTSARRTWTPSALSKWAEPWPRSSTQYPAITQETRKDKSFHFDYSYWSHDGFDADSNGLLTPQPGSNYSDQRKVFTDLVSDGC